MTDLETTLAAMRATADLDARAGAPVGAALRRAVAAVEAVLNVYRLAATDSQDPTVHAEIHGYNTALDEMRRAVEAKLTEENR